MPSGHSANYTTLTDTTFSTSWVWTEKNFVKAVVQSLNDFQPDAVHVIGADVIDGHYGDVWGVKLLLVADIAARMGIPASVVGFSLNNSPQPIIIDVLNSLHRGVRLCLRSQISLQRLQRWTFAQGVLVADCAFLLKAEPAPSQLELWAAERRAKGRRIIALNLHPMLFPEDSRERQTAHVVEKARDAIVEVSRRRNVAWLLLPHDLREVIGDEACLRSLFDDLRPQLGDDIEFYNHADPASVLKGAAGLADGIVTARMHLAIAGLSQGVPVSCITYQDKFEGLFRHFELDTKYLMAPSSALEGQQLLNLIAQFVDEIPVLKDRVMERLPFVMELAKKNYDSH